MPAMTFFVGPRPPEYLMKATAQPLLTFEAYEQILEITSVESSLRVTCCRQILQNLPEHNYAVLSYLMGFLHEVSRESISNKMNSSNLACVFGLNLIWPSQGASSLSALVQRQLPGLHPLYLNPSQHEVDRDREENTPSPISACFLFVET